MDGNRMSSTTSSARETGRPRAPGAYPQPRSRFRRIVRLVLVGGLLVLLTVLVGGAIYLNSLPSVGDAQQRVDAIVQEHSGKEVGIPTPQKVSEAVVAVENSRFYQNRGVDLISLAHGAWGFVTTGSFDAAGATLSQQLVKLLYVQDPHALSGKFEMVGLAIKLNQQYSKPQILEMYLNAVYFGHDAYGVAQASQTYFHTTPAKLTWGEASLIAGLPQAPTSYDPLEHYNLARLRQRHVLSRLVATGVLSQSAADQAFAQTPKLP